MSNTIIIFGAKYLLFLLVGVAGVYFLQQPRNRQKELAIFGVVTCVLVFLVARIASHFYFDPRPFVTGHFVPLIPHDSDNGFPSDHTLLASAVAMIIFYFNRKVGALLMTLAALIGLARIAAGVHSPIDIVGSIIISIVVSWLVYKFVMPMVIKTKFFENAMPTPKT